MILKPGSEDAAIMDSFIEWLERQHTQAGNWCCNISDGRPVEARMRAEQWEVFATSEKFPGTPTGWKQVPNASGRCAASLRICCKMPISSREWRRNGAWDSCSIRR